MIVLVSGATATMRRLADDPRFGRLVVPGSRNRPDALQLVPGRWACDNGAFVAFDAVAFCAMLQQFRAHAHGCRWVAAPDIVGDHVATLDRWPVWSQVIRAMGYPPALVAQDGLHARDVPWRDLACLFIGGTTAWKESSAAATLAAYAQARGVSVHWGRVSTLRRLRQAMRAGADSLDTSGLSRWPDEMTRRFARWLTRIDQQPELRL